MYIFGVHSSVGFVWCCHKCVGVCVGSWRRGLYWTMVGGLENTREVSPNSKSSWKHGYWLSLWLIRNTNLIMLCNQGHTVKKQELLLQLNGMLSYHEQWSAGMGQGWGRGGGGRGGIAPPPPPPPYPSSYAHGGMHSSFSCTWSWRFKMSCSWRWWGSSLWSSWASSPCCWRLLLALKFALTPVLCSMWWSW